MFIYFLEKVQEIEKQNEKLDKFLRKLQVNTRLPISQIRRW